MSSTREIIVRHESPTNPNFGKKPSERTVEEMVDYGIVNIDKPQGPTSHQVSDYIQNILHIDKAGHSGTLDPNVTGVLPVALSKATRIVEVLLKSGKEYVALMHLHREVDEKTMMNAIKKLTGPIRQLPPVRSSVKREERTRSVYYVNVLEIDGKDVLFTIGCQAGTYIRKYIHDLGVMLGTGAHMVELRRTKAGCFDESTLCTLQDLTDAWHYHTMGNDLFIKRIIHPMEEAVAGIPKIWVMDSTVESLCHGISLKNPGISKLESGISKNDMVAVLTLKDELLALGIAQAGTIDMMADKGIAVSINKVFMNPGSYKEK